MRCMRLDSSVNIYLWWSNKSFDCLFFCSPYSRNFSPATSQTTTGMSSYLTSMSPSLDQQQQIMWPVNGQNDEFLQARSGKLPEFHRFQSSTGFVNQPKNTHYTSSFCVQVRHDLFVNNKQWLIELSLERLEPLLVIINAIKLARLEATRTFSGHSSFPRSSITESSSSIPVAISQWVVSKFPN